MPNLPGKGLYAITDCENPDTQQLLETTAAVLANGAVLLQYRNKTDPPAEKYHRARQIQTLCREYAIPFIINDDIQLAIELNADGVHLGLNDSDCRRARVLLGPECIIGISCYNDLQSALTAVENSADYVAFGAFFPTTSKQQTTPADISLLQKAVSQLHIPVAAIGGITPENGGELVTAGAHYLAVISGLYACKDPVTRTRQYARLFNQDTR